MAVFDKFTGIGVASGFKLQAKAPLDGRLVVDTIEDRNALVTEHGAYEGMKVYVKSVGISYELKGTTNNDWRTDGVPVVDTEYDRNAIATKNGAYDKLIVYVTEDKKFYIYSILSKSWDNISEYILKNFYSNGYINIDEITGDLKKVKESIAGYGTLPDSDNNLSKQLNEKLASSEKGVANGVAELDSAGKVPTSQLPESVTSAEKNTIVGVQKNGTDLTPDANRKVNIEVPTKVSELENDSGFVTGSGTVNKAIYADYLSSPVYFDGVGTIFDNDVTHYCICSTAAATASKTGELLNFHLTTGARVIVKFTVTNTAANPTLNVNSSGAKPIIYRGAPIKPEVLEANHTYEFVYNGTSYEIVGDLDTTYTEATTAKAGLMSAADKANVDAMPSITVSATAPTEAVPNSLWFGIE